jgi:hypothetical protein
MLNSKFSWPTLMSGLFILFALAMPSGAQDKPCSAPEYRQFDFWVGEWNLSWGEGENAATGTNVITKGLNSCVIEENFSTSNKKFIGNSLSVYNPKLNRWRQTWVDNQGGYLDFEGGPVGDSMILSREAVEDTAFTHQRMVWYNISKDTLDWNWEKSTDSGRTWKVFWHIDYTREK